MSLHRGYDVLREYALSTPRMKEWMMSEISTSPSSEVLGILCMSLDKGIAGMWALYGLPLSRRRRTKGQCYSLESSIPVEVRYELCIMP